MRARVNYGLPDDPVMAHILSVIGNEGYAVWHRRQIAAVQAVFERDPAAAIGSDQVMQIARDTCPRSREEVDLEIGDDDTRGAIDVRNNIIVSAMLDATANGGLLRAGRFSAIVLSAGEKAESEINLAIEKAKTAAEYPDAGGMTGKVN